MARKFKAFSSELGVTLIETLVSLAIVGIVTSAFLGAMASASQATLITDEQTAALSLAQSQMEYVKTLDYIRETTEYPPASIPSDEDYANYSATIEAEPLHTPDDGIQKITVTISHHGKEIITLEAYKVE